MPKLMFPSIPSPVVPVYFAPASKDIEAMPWLCEEKGISSIKARKTNQRVIEKRVGV